MKASMYFNYTSRSLLRGGQRTILAVFCVAVGVMAIVALQLVGNMLQNSLSSNTRDTNGGDIAVATQNVPFKKSDLSFFTSLKNNGTITNYTAVTTTNGSLSASGSTFQAFSVDAVDPNNYPIVSQPTFVTPGNGSFSSLLTKNQVIVTQNFLDTYHKKLGDSFDVYIKKAAGSAETLHVKIAGVVASTGVFAQSGSLVLVSSHDYQATAPNTPVSYSVVDVTTANAAHTDAAVKAINQQFPLASTQTVADALKAQQSSMDLINKFLEIAGLLALLIGGVGIVNTMGVLLSRRKTEIAMLKTAGYRRKDLYLLFGLEAGLLGLIGGVVGAAAATGVSYIVRGLMENLGFNILFELNFQVILSGVAIGFATALIFGLLPIVQAANVRPLHVIREFESRNRGGRALTLLLLLLLSVLFCLLATLILNRDLVLGIAATYGAFAFLLVLSAFFSLLIFAVSKLPVPERLHLKYAGLILVGIAVSVLVYQVMPVFGIFLLVVSLLGVLVVLLPRSWKVSARMALRNLGRRRARTLTTMLALFIGVYGIGLIVGLGHDVLTQTSSVVNQNAPYNLVATASGDESNALQARLSTIPGLTSHREDLFVSSVPMAIDGQPIQQVLGKNLQS